MRKWILLFAMMCGTAVADKIPTVIGYLPNKAAGEITLTSETCERDRTKKFAFIKNEGGKLSLGGCWRMIESNVLISWEDGDVYSYPVESIIFTPEFNEWSERNNNKPRSNPNVY